MHHSRLEQREVEGGWYKPPSLLYPFPGTRSSQRVCEYLQGTVTGSASCKHSPLQALTAENSQLMTLVTPSVPVGAVVGAEFLRSPFFSLRTSVRRKKVLISSQMHWGIWYGCGLVTPWFLLSPTPQDVPDGDEEVVERW